MQSLLPIYQGKQHRVIQDQIKTMNNMGYMFLRPDPALDAFLDHVAKTQGYFADIGAAYGYATVEALKRGGRVMAIDLDQRHLDVLFQNCPPSDKPRLEVNCGHFPNTIKLPTNVFDGILLSRILIFLNREEIFLALTKTYNALKEGGFAYIVSPSPLRQKWEALKPGYEKQRQENVPWPGRTENLWELIPETKDLLPNQIQLIDAPSLEQGLIQAGFKVEVCGYFPSESAPPDQALGLTYAIALKVP